MNQETIQISTFRKNLRKECYAVRLKKKELIVTYHNQSLFKVINLFKSLTPPDHDYVECSVAIVRNKMTEFIELIEQHGAVILISNGKRLVKCELI